MTDEAFCVYQKNAASRQSVGHLGELSHRLRLALLGRETWAHHVAYRTALSMQFVVAGLAG
jgi:hypothetical protein